jgi:hypothetical protein
VELPDLLVFEELAGLVPVNVTLRGRLTFYAFSISRKPPQPDPFCFTAALPGDRAP